MKRVSLVLVAHRSSDFLAPAVESFRSAAAYAAVIAEVVIVEQSEDDDELSAAEAAAADRVVAKRNRGYAAGVNAGISEAKGDPIFVANPDIRFERAALAPMLKALEGGFGLVGPLFTLGDFLLPPADVQRPGAEMRRLRARRNSHTRRRHLRREIRYWRTVWDAEEPVAVRSLSGALIGFPRKVAYRLGPWDEKYFLYFEDSDWCLRAEQLGIRMGQVPASRVEHRWGHSADPAQSAELFKEARERFYKENFKLSSLVGDGSPSTLDELEAPAMKNKPGEEDRSLWLASPLPQGFPAAGAYIVGDPTKAIDRFLAASHLDRATVSRFDPQSHQLDGPWTFREAAKRKARRAR